MGQYIEERLAWGYKISIWSDNELASNGHVEIHDTPDFGRVMYIDGHFQTSTKDEFVYHEMMTHPALLLQHLPKRALVIGGGDGGAVEEILKHKCIEQVVLVEIDPTVINTSKEWLQEINHGALEDKKTHVIIDDGYRYVTGVVEVGVSGWHDLIVLDLTDPEGPTKKLYTQ